MDLISWLTTVSPIPPNLRRRRKGSVSTGKCKKKRERENEEKERDTHDEDSGFLVSRASIELCHILHFLPPSPLFSPVPSLKKQLGDKKEKLASHSYVVINPFFFSRSLSDSQKKVRKRRNNSLVAKEEKKKSWRFWLCLAPPTPHSTFPHFWNEKTQRIYCSVVSARLWQRWISLKKIFRKPRRFPNAAPKKRERSLKKKDFSDNLSLSIRVMK